MLINIGGVILMKQIVIVYFFKYKFYNYVYWVNNFLLINCEIKFIELFYKKIVKQDEY